MSYQDDSFCPNDDLQRSLELLADNCGPSAPLPIELPEIGIGERQTLEILAPHVLGKAARLDDPLAMAHMDPPTPWLTWAMALWNARLNQNLLHPATAPFAQEAERRVIAWLTPFFGMRGGHLCSGSTIANLTALWAARDAGGATSVVTSTAAHLSIEKAANILGMPFTRLPTNTEGEVDEKHLTDLDHACLVLTAGTTTTGAIDPMRHAGEACWTHVDAAWAGPLRLSNRYGSLLSGIEAADSIAISAHKWLFQPKDSALVLFRENERANRALSLSSGYLASANVGVQGSRGAAAVPLLATLIAWGQSGLAARIEHCMSLATQLADWLERDSDFELRARPKTGVNLFRPVAEPVPDYYSRLPDGVLSVCEVDGEQWLRSVAANPIADVDAITAVLHGTLQQRT